MYLGKFILRKRNQFCDDRKKYDNEGFAHNASFNTGLNSKL